MKAFFKMPDKTTKAKQKSRLIITVSIVSILLISAFVWMSDITAEGPVDLGDGRSKVPVVFEGGYETKPVDHGRPVILIASALGVEEQVFRDAFSNVNPAPGGTIPGQHRVMDNKKILMDALGPHGITNERLDSVSNYYRYSKGWGQMWKHRPAKAYAIVENGRVTDFEIVDGGAGYSSLPKISIKGVASMDSKIELSYGRDFESNGSIISISQ